MLTEFQDVVVLDVTFDNVVLDDVSFEDSVTFIVEFEDFNRHPFDRYLQAIVFDIVGIDGYPTCTKTNNASLGFEAAIIASLTKQAPIAPQGVEAITDLTSDLVVRCPHESTAVAVGCSLSGAITKTFYGSRRRCRAWVAIGSKLNLHGPLQSTIEVYTSIEAPELTTKFPMDDVDIAIRIGIEGVPVQRISIGPHTASLEVTFAGNLTRVKIMEPFSVSFTTVVGGTMIPVKAMETVVLSFIDTISGSPKLYQSMKGDDDLNLYGDDDYQLGDIF